MFEESRVPPHSRPAKPQGRCFAVPVTDITVNAITGCYHYPEAVRFEIEKKVWVLTGAQPTS
jgi:hypothetical protein